MAGDAPRLLLHHLHVLSARSYVGPLNLKHFFIRSVRVSSDARLAEVNSEGETRARASQSALHPD